jgi:hypothetical protein
MGEQRPALALAVILVLSIPSMTYAQNTGYYSNDADINFAAFYLTIYSPNDQTVYADTMLLKFNITWTAYVSLPFPQPPPVKGDYSYSIDDGPRVTIEPNQSSSDRLIVHPKGNFTINPSFSYSVNVSSLANGYHKIVIIVGLYRHSDYYYINQSIPTLFLVQNLTPTHSPNWSEVTRFTGGGGIHRTEPFTCEHVDWRIRWEYEPRTDDPPASAFHIYIQTHEFISSRIDSMIKLGTEETNGTLYIHDNNGTFHIDVLSSIPSYILIIEQNLNSIPEFPSWTPLILMSVVVIVLTVVYKRRLLKTN